jgi:hypothetical protein
MVKIIKPNERLSSGKYGSNPVNDRPRRDTLVLTSICAVLKGCFAVLRTTALVLSTTVLVLSTAKQRKRTTALVLGTIIKGKRTVEHCLTRVRGGENIRFNNHYCQGNREGRPYLRATSFVWYLRLRDCNGKPDLVVRERPKN